MRKFASFSFACALSADDRDTRINAVSGLVDQWLASKGQLGPKGQFLMREGKANLQRTNTNSTAGAIHEVILTQPTNQGEFRTVVTYAASEDTLGIHSTLWGLSDALVPVEWRPNCPNVIRSILDLPYGWCYESTPVNGSLRTFRGPSGGDELLALLWDAQRAVPVVAISEDNYGALLHPRLPETLADRLASLAVVVCVDAPASWRITQIKGKSWSCYNGAVRLYWPRLAEYDQFFQHPLWSVDRVMERSRDTEHAMNRVMEQIKRMIFAQSAFAVAEPDVFEKIRIAAHKDRVAAQLASAKNTKDYQKLAISYSKEVDALKSEVLKQRDEIRGLQRELSSLRLALHYKEGDTDGIKPDELFVPETVAEAVEAARKRFSTELIFGNDVAEGVLSLAADAGPPDKILDYLEILGEMTKTMNGPGLGKSIWLWLQEWGVYGSDEDPAVRNQRAHRDRRSWDNGQGESTYFDKHLKPTDGTSPDRCVRIYFEYNKTLMKTVVGWVGRHPD